MSFYFHPEAEVELISATNYYENMEIGLGYDFAREILSTINRIVAFPKAWPEIEPNIRRSLVRRFPYGILYSEDRGTILVIAVMHLHREPNFWKHRL